MKLTFILFALFYSAIVYTQDFTSTQNDSHIINPSIENLVKFNPVPLVWGTGSLSYERKIANQWAIGATLNYRPKGKAPFKSTLQKIFENDTSNKNLTFDVDKLKYSNFSFAPEIKFYFGKKGAFSGFYIAAFAKIETTKVDYAYRFNELLLLNKDPDLPLKGNINAFSGGIYCGIQWNIGKNFYLDWQIIGGNYGFANINISSNRNLTPDEQIALNYFAKDLKDNFKNMEYEVNEDGIKIDGKMPWAGLRTGLSIAYSF